MGKGLRRRERGSSVRDRFFPVNPGEGKLVALVFAYFFLITAPHTIIKTLRTTDLLVKMGVGGLPLAYLSAAVATGLFVFLFSRLRLRISNRGLITASLVAFAATGLLFQAVLETDFGRRSEVLPYLYWTWASVLIIVLMTHFWMAVNDLLNPREGRRLIGLLCNGGVLGGVLGGLMAGFLTRSRHAGLLLPLACALLFACVFVVRALFALRPPGRDQASPQPPLVGQPASVRGAGFRANWDTVRKNSYLVKISALAAAAVIVSTLVDFQFLSAATDRYQFDAVELQAFLGFFYAGLTVAALFLNLVSTAWLYRVMKPGAILLATPAFLLLGSFGVLVLPFSLVFMTVFKGGDEGLSFSINQSIRELVYIPVESDLKNKARPFIDMFVSRVAKVAAALILFVFALLLDKKVKGLTPIFDPGLARWLSLAIMAIVVPWAVIAWRTGKEYVQRVGEHIVPDHDRKDAEVRQKADVDLATLLTDTLDSRSRSLVHYALHVFDLLEHGMLTPEVRAAISGPADEAKNSSVSGFFDAEGTAWMSGGREEADHGAFVDDVRIILSLRSYRRLIAVYADQVIKDGPGSEVPKMELAKLIGLLGPDKLLAEALSRLILDQSLEVSSAALKSAARLGQKEHLSAVVQRLGHPKLRGDAVDALHRYGADGLGVLEQVLADTNGDTAPRSAAVEVLARLGTQEAVRILAGGLGGDAGELDSDICDAFDRLRMEQPALTFPVGAARRKMLALIEDYCRTYLDLNTPGPGSDDEDWKRQMGFCLDARLADIFKLLGVIYPRDDIVKAYQNLKTGTRNSVGFAVELLDNILQNDIKVALLPIVDDLPPAEKVRRFRKICSARRASEAGASARNRISRIFRFLKLRKFQ